MNASVSYAILKCVKEKIFFKKIMFFSFALHLFSIFFVWFLIEMPGVY